MRRVMLWLVALAWLTAGSEHVQASATGVAVPMWMELDGAYYSVDPMQEIAPQFLLDVKAMVLPFTSATQCRRRSGDAMVVGPLTLYYSPQVLPLPLASVEIQLVPMVFRLRSTTGDIECLGTVAAPPPPPPPPNPDLVYASGFETGDASE
jgi:hypothetical protein